MFKKKQTNKKVYNSKMEEQHSRDIKTLIKVSQMKARYIRTMI